MAKAETFHISLITPERAVLETEATFAAFPAHDGEMGMLAHRAPLVCRLGIGILRIEGGGEVRRYFIDGGFAQIVDNRLTILTEQAKSAGEISSEGTAKLLVEARAMKIRDDASFVAKSRAMRRAQVQMRFKRS